MVKETSKNGEKLLKQMVFEIRHSNWGLIGPFDWKDVIYKVYVDLTVNIEKIYNSELRNDETISTKLTEKTYDELLKCIELSKTNTIVSGGCDGSAWEIIQYQEGKIVWKRELDYIYGIEALEKMAKILMDLV